MSAAQDTLFAEDAARRSSGFTPAPGSAFRCVVSDPPWQVNRLESPGSADFGTQERVLRSVPLEYPTMSVEQIAALKIPAEDDAHLYIWTINSYIEETYDIARAWGFEPSTMLYWLKQPMGLGLGGAFVPCVEPILFCRRGKLAVKRRYDRNWWGWPRGKHSQKPEEFQTVVESVSPGPYLEMFARRKRPGWQSWGNEVASDVILTPNERKAHPRCGRTKPMNTPETQPPASLGAAACSALTELQEAMNDLSTIRSGTSATSGYIDDMARAKVRIGRASTILADCLYKASNDPSSLTTRAGLVTSHDPR